MHLNRLMIYKRDGLASIKKIEHILVQNGVRVFGSKNDIVLLKFPYITFKIIQSVKFSIKFYYNKIN